MSTTGLDRSTLKAILERLNVITNQNEYRVQRIDSRFENLFLLQFTTILETKQAFIGIVNMSTLLGAIDGYETVFVNILMTKCSDVDYVHWLLQTKYEPFANVALEQLEGGDQNADKFFVKFNNFMRSY